MRVKREPLSPVAVEGSMEAGVARGLHRFVGGGALELRTYTLGITLGLLAGQPAHITELPDTWLTEGFVLHGREG